MVTSRTAAAPSDRCGASRRRRRLSPIGPPRMVRAEVAVVQVLEDGVAQPGLASRGHRADHQAVDDDEVVAAHARSPPAGRGPCRGRRRPPSSSAASSGRSASTPARAGRGRPRRRPARARRPARRGRGSGRCGRGAASSRAIAVAGGTLPPPSQVTKRMSDMVAPSQGRSGRGRLRAAPRRGGACAPRWRRGSGRGRGAAASRCRRRWRRPAGRAASPSVSSVEVGREDGGHPVAVHLPAAVGDLADEALGRPPGRAAPARPSPRRS